MNQLRNYMEYAVLDLMKEILPDINVCTCEICQLDIAAKTLNDLPAKYFVTKKGELYSRINALKSQFEVDIIAAITKSAIIVKRNARHE